MLLLWFSDELFSIFMHVNRNWKFICLGCDDNCPLLLWCHFDFVVECHDLKLCLIFTSSHVELLITVINVWFLFTFSVICTVHNRNVIARFFLSCWKISSAGLSDKMIWILYKRWLTTLSVTLKFTLYKCRLMFLYVLCIARYAVFLCTFIFIV